MRFTVRGLPPRVAATIATMATIALVAPLALAGCGPAAAPTCGSGDDGSCLRVLFIGNSYTYVNDLPGTFAKLAQAGGHTVETDSLATGGQTLDGHLQDTATGQRLDARKWDYVVLQEQSEVPSAEASRDYAMYPAARSLVSLIRDRHETPLFFMTWAHRDGWPENGLPDYESMQRSIDDAYISIAQELDAPVAPVGVTWFVVRRQDSQIGLWQDDGSHPTTAGTYLAACVFYATIFRQSPEGLGYEGGLASETAQVLQKAAADNVLQNPAQWGLH